MKNTDEPISETPAAVGKLIIIQQAAIDIFDLSFTSLTIFRVSYFDTIIF